MQNFDATCDAGDGDYDVIEETLVFGDVHNFTSNNRLSYCHYWSFKQCRFCREMLSLISTYLLHELIMYKSSNYFRYPLTFSLSKSTKCALEIVYSEPRLSLYPFTAACYSENGAKKRRLSRDLTFV